MANYSVTGRLLDTRGQGISGKDIDVRHQIDVASDESKGTAQTSADGSYSVTWTGDGPFDVVVIASDPSAGEMARSAIVCNVPETLTVDLVDGNATYEGRSEFQRVVDAVDAALGTGNAPKDTTADKLEWLACKANVYPPRVVLRVQAAKLADGTSVPEKAFYAMGRMGLPVTKGELVRLDPSVWRSSIQAAHDRNIIRIDDTGSPGIDDDLDTIVDALNAVVVKSASTAAPAGEPSLRAVLETAGYTAAVDQENFMQLWVDRTSESDFWTQVADPTNFGTAGHDKLKFTLRVAALADNYQALMTGLQSKYGTELNAFVDLATWDVDDWEDYLTTQSIGAPSDLPGATEADRIRRYAETLDRIVEEAHPTPVLRARLARDASPGVTNTDEVQAFLDQNTDFEITTTNIARYLDDNPTALNGLDGDLVKKNLAIVQRVHGMTPRYDKYEVTKVLLNDGITSAYDISRKTLQETIDAYATSLDGPQDGEDLATQIWHNAQFRTAGTMAIASTFGEAFNDGNPAAMGRTDAELGTDDGLPTLEGLFGSLDFCDCRHCRSVFSPAAYLADLLKFVKDRGLWDSGLKLRRPDLEHIQLSCENTQKVLPYIDLVNEVLERAVDSQALTGLDTTWEEDALRLNPEHQHDPAYDNTLSAKKFPFDLPFSLPTVEGRIYFEHLGVDRNHAMDVLYESMADAPTYAARGAERIGMSATEYNIIGGIDTGTPDGREFWGLPSDPNYYDTLRDSVEMLLEHASMDFEELQELLSLDFVNPGGAIDITSSPESCKLEDITLTSFSAADADRFHRFVRLYRRTGMRPRDLDVLLVDFGTSTLNSSFLFDLGLILRFANDARMSVKQLAPLWVTKMDIRTRDDGELSRYAELFQNPGVGLDAAFEIDTQTGDIKNTPVMDATHTATIVAALEISEEDFLLLKSRSSSPRRRLGSTSKTSPPSTSTSTSPASPA